MKDLEKDVRDVIKNNNWMVLSTASEKGIPQSSVVMYVSDGDVFYVHTGKDFLKTKNILKNSKVGVAIPFYKNLLHMLIKKAPPAEVHFRGEAEILPFDAKEPLATYEKEIDVDFSEEEMKNGAWIKITPSKKIVCYGVGVSLRTMRKPEEAMAVVELT